MLKELGVDGMSSDETDVGDPIGQKRILIKDWRNSNLTIWLRTFDEVYMRRREKPVGEEDLRGNLPHIRTPSDKHSQSSKVVRGLPINAYEPEWLERLHPLDYADVDPKPTPYRFLHDNSVISFLYVPDPTLHCQNQSW